MKKILALTLGAMLAAGSAGMASAAGQIDFSGLYQTFFLNSWNQAFGGKDNHGNHTTNDSFFVNRLELDFTFNATDEVSVYWRLRAPDNHRWGTPMQPAETVHAYGEVKQDWGTTSVGRLTSDYSNFGLSALGWAPDGVDEEFTSWLPFDDDAEIDGIRWSNRWDNGFQLTAQFNRLGAAQTTFNSGALRGDEEFNDRFILEPAYFWDDGGASLAFVYQRDRTREDPLGSGNTIPALKVFYLNPAVAHSWGDFSFHFEGKFAWGRDGAAAILAPNADGQVRGYGLYLDFDYNYGPGNVMLAGWWASGNSRNGRGGRKDFVDMGALAPFLVAMQSNNDWRNEGVSAIEIANELAGPTANGHEQNGNANHWAIALNGAHSLTDDVSLRYTLGYLSLVNTREGAGKSIGWEADIGVQFQLLDNLSFTSTFGYLFAGKALDGGTARPGYSARDSYNWFNTLGFSF